MSLQDQRRNVVSMSLVGYKIGLKMGSNVEGPDKKDIIC